MYLGSASPSPLAGVVVVLPGPVLSGVAGEVGDITGVCGAAPAAPAAHFLSCFEGVVAGVPLASPGLLGLIHPPVPTLFPPGVETSLQKEDRELVLDKSPFLHL